jgi:hypothetical protein
VGVRSRTPWESTYIFLSSSTPSHTPPANALTFSETIARYSLANLAGQRTGTKRNERRSGITADFAIDDKTDVLVVSVPDWARARGYSYRLNPDTAIIALTKGENTILIPLGAKAIKVGNEWRELPDIVRTKEAEHLVPFNAIEAARN